MALGGSFRPLRCLMAPKRPWSTRAAISGGTRRLASEVELAGLEPAILWVRFGPGSVGPDRLAYLTYEVVRDAWRASDSAGRRREEA
jgi:hypothetical protein